MCDKVAVDKDYQIEKWDFGVKISRYFFKSKGKTEVCLRCFLENANFGTPLVIK